MLNGIMQNGIVLRAIKLNVYMLIDILLNPFC